MVCAHHSLILCRRAQIEGEGLDHTLVVDIHSLLAEGFEGLVNLVFTLGVNLFWSIAPDNGSNLLAPNIEITHAAVPVWFNLTVLSNIVAKEYA